MRRKIAGLKPEQIRQLATEEVDLPVSTQDFSEAIAKCNKSVSKEDLAKYEKWMREFGSSWYDRTPTPEINAARTMDDRFSGCYYSVCNVTIAIVEIFTL